jgi:XTP/dITP diphosphohydrolase
MMKLLVATSNRGKLNEYREMMSALSSELPIEWVSLDDVGLGGMDVAETGDTFHANAIIKAQAYSRASGLATLADDSGIVVDALDGAPGVHSARYAPTEAERIIKLLSALHGIPRAQRTARFVCVTALALPDDVMILSEGRIEGWIAFAPRGTNGFGYDPVMELLDENAGRTLAELPREAKNTISHRGRALAKLIPFMRPIFG